MNTMSTASHPPTGLKEIMRMMMWYKLRDPAKSKVPTWFFTKFRKIKMKIIMTIMIAKKKTQTAMKRDLMMSPGTKMKTKS